MGDFNIGDKLGEKEWREHFVKIKEKNGSLVHYLKAHGLSACGYYYWKKKLGVKLLLKTEPKVLKIGRDKISPFIPMEILPDSGKGPKTEKEMGNLLPDPKWLAELIGQLIQKMGEVK